MGNSAMTLKHVIIAALEENDQIEGTEYFANQIGARDKTWLIRLARLIANEGKITIIPSRGGRGNKTIYRVNRNSPGYRRKVKQ